MSMEDWFMRNQGLDPVVVHRAADSLVHLLGVVKAQVKTVQQLADGVKATLAHTEELVNALQAELPRAEQFVADVQSQVAGFEAKQRQINGR